MKWQASSSHMHSKNSHSVFFFFSKTKGQPFLPCQFQSEQFYTARLKIKCDTSFWSANQSSACLKTLNKLSKSKRQKYVLLYTQCSIFSCYALLLEQNKWRQYKWRHRKKHLVAIKEKECSFIWVIKHCPVVSCSRVTLVRIIRFVFCCCFSLGVTHDFCLPAV